VVSGATNSATGPINAGRKSVRAHAPTIGVQTEGGERVVGRKESNNTEQRE